jgi:hypothetical protein
VRGSTALPNATARALGLYAIRFQVVFVYASTFAFKLLSPMWRDGSAVGRVLRSERFAHWPMNVHPAAGVIATYGVLAFEGMFVLVLWRRARPWLLACGVALHVAFAILLKVPEFSAVILACYPALLTDDEASALVARLRPAQIFGGRVRQPAGSASR